MKLEAIKRLPGRPPKEAVEDNCGPVGHNFDGMRSRDVLAESVEDSARQISRYIRLTYLIQELQDFVDEGKIKLRPAVELSYLDEESQRDVVDRIDETEAFPSHAQAIRLRKAYEEGDINYEKVMKVMAEEKPNQKVKIKISFDRLMPYIPKGFTDDKVEDFVIKAVEHYHRYLERQRDQVR